MLPSVRRLLAAAMPGAEKTLLRVRKVLPAVMRGGKFLPTGSGQLNLFHTRAPAPLTAEKYNMIRGDFAYVCELV